MIKKSVQFSSKKTDFYFDASMRNLAQLASKKNTVLITDENIFKAHQDKFKNWNTIVLKPGEQYKVQATVDTIIDQLIRFQADRTTTLVGIGGGVITDITGYVAGIYMRGIPFGFIPTSVLAMVDAAIGGKNGIDVGVFKNIAGLIRQPDFILYDTTLLTSLPEAEWINGMAEVIKHACIKDATMFKQLRETDIAGIRKNKSMLNSLIQKNVLLKTKVVKADENEKGERRLLNFGHTIAHAIENLYELKHGHAVAIGITAACRISETYTGFRKTNEVMQLLEQYQLPSWAEFDREKALEVLQMDKKRELKTMNYVLLEKIGKGVVQTIEMKELHRLIKSL
ncbi:MAG TPA: 3-dehydroquinate synthase [Parasegetibacter sp.]